MERQNGSVMNGGVKLPIGFRFHPTDEELVVHYLKRKAVGIPLPALVIPEFDVFKSPPQSLPGALCERNRYFFCKRKRYCFVNHKCKRSTSSGYWKPIGKEREIFAHGTNQKVGIRRTLVFYEANKCSNCTKTRWFMRQYCLVVSATTAAATNQVYGMGNEEEWRVYNVFQSEREAIKRKLSGVTTDYFGPNTIDFSTQADQSDIGPPPTSPSSSTEANRSVALMD